MDKPEALRLEDVPRIMDNANAELRRLHAECNDLAHQLNESNERNGRLKAQCDALLEALKLARPYISVRTMAGYHAEVKADAAIKAVEENT